LYKTKNRDAIFRSEPDPPEFAMKVAPSPSRLVASRWYAQRFVATAEFSALVLPNYRQRPLARSEIFSYLLHSMLYRALGWFVHR
jgi:hypothetical protein